MSQIDDEKSRLGWIALGLIFVVICISVLAFVGYKLVRSRKEKSTGAILSDAWNNHKTTFEDGRWTTRRTERAPSPEYEERWVRDESPKPNTSENYQIYEFPCEESAKYDLIRKFLNGTLIRDTKKVDYRYIGPLADGCHNMLNVLQKDIKVTKDDVDKVIKDRFYKDFHYGNLEHFLKREKVYDILENEITYSDDEIKKHQELKSRGTVNYEFMETFLNESRNDPSSRDVEDHLIVKSFNTGKKCYSNGEIYQHDLIKGNIIREHNKIVKDKIINRYLIGQSYNNEQEILNDYPNFITHNDIKKAFDYKMKNETEYSEIINDLHRIGDISGLGDEYEGHKILFSKLKTITTNLIEKENSVVNSVITTSTIVNNIQSETTINNTPNPQNLNLDLGNNSKKNSFCSIS